MHTVTAGQSLSIIGNIYGVDWRDIARVNGISPPYYLTVARRLAIPGISCNVSASGSLTDSLTEWTPPSASGDSRALILAATNNAPQSMPYVLLDNRGNLLTNAGPPAALNHWMILKP